MVGGDLRPDESDSFGGDAVKEINVGRVVLITLGNVNVTTAVFELLVFGDGFI